MEKDEKKKVRNESRRVVNVASKELEAWLETEASRSVGQTRKVRTKQSRRRIVEIRRTRHAELSETTTRT